MLYTGKGDGGTTKTFEKTPNRISKASELPECLGTLDELNAFVGFCKVRARDGVDPVVTIGNKRYATSAILHDVQETLFIVQAEVAGAPKKVRKTKVTHVESLVNTIETWRWSPPRPGTIRRTRTRTSRCSWSRPPRPGSRRARS